MQWLQLVPHYHRANLMILFLKQLVSCAIFFIQIPKSAQVGHEPYTSLDID